VARQLDGDFAIVVVDLKAGTVTVARDPYGVRPLYKGFKRYGGTNNLGVTEQLYFGSELKTVINDSPLASYFVPGTYEIYNINGYIYVNITTCNLITVRHDLDDTSTL
jgi:asparagine synthetase B (glutamine-hydrolysing)